VLVTATLPAPVYAALLPLFPGLVPVLGPGVPPQPPPLRASRMPLSARSPAMCHTLGGVGWPLRMVNYLRLHTCGAAYCSDNPTPLPWWLSPLAGLDAYGSAGTPPFVQHAAVHNFQMS